MIRIKDYIFNENEIREIKQYKNYLRLDLTYSGPYLHIDDATFDDIEWNYGSQDNQDVASKYLVDRLKVLDDACIKMQSSLNKLRDENRKLKEGSEK